MRKLLPAILALSVPGLTQVTVHLRDHGTGFYVVGASNTTPIVIQTGAPHGFTAADAGSTVSLWNVQFDNGSGTGWYRVNTFITCGNAGTNVLYGDFKIASVPDSTHFAINDVSGNSVPARGSWCDGGGGVDNGGPQWGGKTSAYTLVAGMRGWYDGDNGTYTRRFSLGTNNGLTSLVVNGNLATAVTSFPNYISTGAQIAVWGSGNAALDNSHKGAPVTVDSPTQFHFTTAGVPNGTYSNSHNACGASVTADCLRVSSMAITGNPFWDAVEAGFSFYTGQRSIHDGGTLAFSPLNGGGALFGSYFGSAAMVLLVDQGNTAALSDVEYALNHVEHSLSTAWVIDETQSNGGYSNWSDTISYLFEGMANVYAVGKVYLTPAQRQTFLDKMFNDIIDPGGCTRSIALQKQGATIGYSGASTITGTRTLWMSDPDPNQRLSPGDVIFKPTLASGTSEYYVTAVNSDTSVSVVSTPADTTTWSGQSFVFYHQWAPGTCGAIWFKKHWLGAYSQPGLYPPSGGDFQTWHDSPTRYHPAEGTNNGYSWSEGLLALAAAAADDDPRAALRFEEAESYLFDWMLPYSIGYTTGFQHSGAYYSWGRTVPDAEEAATWLTNSVTGFPDLNLSGDWTTRPPMLKLYGLLPDQFAGLMWPVRWGTEDGDNHVNPSACEFTLDPVGRLAPQSSEAQYFRTWHLNNTAIYRSCAANEFQALGDPTVGSLDYKLLPTQYLFRDTSQATCTALGMNCPATTRGDGFISRTGWNNPNDTHVTFMSRAYIGDHDLQQAGALHIYKSGPLVHDGKQVPGALTANDDPTALEDILVFGGSNNLYTGEGSSSGRNGIAFIDRWSGSSPYGDGQSRYAYAEADVSGMYKNRINRAKVHALHFKKPGAAEEIVMQYFDVDVSGSPISVQGEIHYPQNGEAVTQLTPAEGATTCPGASGCAGLNLDRVMMSQENGSGPYTNGIITKVLSAGAIRVQYDGPGYPGNQGHDVRVSICGGSQCGASVSTADWLVVHKVTSSLADTNLPAIALNSDARWTGVQTAGTVALFSRGGNLPITATLQTTHGGTAQYLIAGLEGGHTYQAYRQQDGTNAVVQAVSDGDNTLYFEATAGTYSIFPTGLMNLFIGVKPPLHSREPWQYDFKVAGDPASYVWSVSGGALPPGLTLSSDGLLSGMPVQTGTYQVSIMAQESGSHASAEATLTLTVMNPAIAVTAMGAAERGYVLYGAYGLDALQQCSITASTQLDFSTTAENIADAGGAAERQVVLGESAPLLDGTPYYVRVVCGAVQGTSQFVTAAAGASVATTIPISVSVPPALAVANVQVEYGSTPQLGNTLTAACTQGCTVAVPAMSENIIYWKRLFLNGASRVIAQSSIAPLLVSR